jgi:hypothetical protein
MVCRTPDGLVLDALQERRFADLPRLTASDDEVRQRTAIELERALERLRAVNGAYWDPDWRR